MLGNLEMVLDLCEFVILQATGSETYSEITRNYHRIDFYFPLPLELVAHGLDEVSYVVTEIS